MHESSFDLSYFPMGLCGACDKRVLTFISFDEASAELRLCVHCEAPTSGTLDWVTAGELEAQGYDFGAPPARTGGCGGGSGCGACSMRKH
ncbi:MAG: hypothetical protein ACREP6_16265 [Candidatus Binataceae bacterium]